MAGARTWSTPGVPARCQGLPVKEAPGDTFLIPPSPRSPQSAASCSGKYCLLIGQYFLFLIGQYFSYCLLIGQDWESCLPWIPAASVPESPLARSHQHRLSRPYSAARQSQVSLQYLPPLRPSGLQNRTNFYEDLRSTGACSYLPLEWCLQGSLLSASTSAPG